MDIRETGAIAPVVRTVLKLDKQEHGDCTHGAAQSRDRDNSTRLHGAFSDNIVACVKQRNERSGEKSVRPSRKRGHLRDCSSILTRTSVEGEETKPQKESTECTQNQIVSRNLGADPIVVFVLAEASNARSEDVGSHERRGASHSVHGTATGKVHDTALEHPSVAVEDESEKVICERYVVQTNQNSVIQELT